jgi:hypothetical protein
MSARSRRRRQRSRGLREPRPEERSRSSSTGRRRAMSSTYRAGGVMGRSGPRAHPLCHRSPSPISRLSRPTAREVGCGFRLWPPRPARRASNGGPSPRRRSPLTVCDMVGRRAGVEIRGAAGLESGGRAASGARVEDYWPAGPRAPVAARRALPADPPRAERLTRPWRRSTLVLTIGDGVAAAAADRSRRPRAMGPMVNRNVVPDEQGNIAARISGAATTCSSCPPAPA